MAQVVDTERPLTSRCRCRDAQQFPLGTYCKFCKGLERRCLGRQEAVLAIARRSGMQRWSRQAEAVKLAPHTARSFVARLKKRRDITVMPAHRQGDRGDQPGRLEQAGRGEHDGRIPRHQAAATRRCAKRRSPASIVGSQLDPLYSMTKGGVTLFTKSRTFIAAGRRRLSANVGPSADAAGVSRASVARRTQPKIFPVPGSSVGADQVANSH